MGWHGKRTTRKQREAWRQEELAAGIVAAPSGSNSVLPVGTVNTGPRDVKAPGCCVSPFSSMCALASNDPMPADANGRIWAKVMRH
jgi:hypothetical protein